MVVNRSITSDLASPKAATVHLGTELCNLKIPKFIFYEHGELLDNTFRVGVIQFLADNTLHTGVIGHHLYTYRSSMTLARNKLE